MVNTSVTRFSAGYCITEFAIHTGNFDTIQMSRHRADDIRAWWTERGLPVVLRGDQKHMVPEEDDDLDYAALRVPDYIWGDQPEGDAAFLVPDATHTRRLTGTKE